MRVLVTGGAGYIGCHLTRVLQAAGHTVRVLDLQPAGTAGECFRGSITDPEVVAQALHGIEVVYHLAWAFRTWRFHPQIRPEEERAEIEENLCGTLNLLQASLLAGVKHFLFASSAVVYGPTGPLRVNEEYPCHPERSTLGGPMYGIGKLAAEQMCLVYQQRGLPVTAFRLHGVFDDGELNQFGRMIRQALAGAPLQVTRGAGGEYAHVEDVLAGFLTATGDPRAFGETFNLAGTHTYDDAELARFVVETAGSGSPIEWIEDPTQAMVSVSVEKIGRTLGFRPEKGEFLTPLIGQALQAARRGRLGSGGRR